MTTNSFYYTILFLSSITTFNNCVAQWHYPILPSVKEKENII